eukprot:jgi/Mesen1/3712/ME000202S02798
MLVSAMSLPTMPEKPPDKDAPTLRVTLAKSAYRPGEVVIASIDLTNALGKYTKAQLLQDLEEPSSSIKATNFAGAVLIEDLIVELKGLEKLDPAWVQVPKLPAGSKQPRGERAILESQPTSIVSDVVIEREGSRTYTVRVTLPKVLPPSYRGTAVRYHYYLSVYVKWSPVVTANGESSDRVQGGVMAAPAPLQVRTPIRLWTLPNSSGLTPEEIGAEHHHGSGGIVPVAPVEVEIQWREKNSRSSWVAMTDALSGAEDGDYSQEEELSDAASASQQHSEEDGRGRRVFERLGSYSGPSSSSMATTTATATVEETDDEEHDDERGEREEEEEHGRGQNGEATTGGEAQSSANERLLVRAESEPPPRPSQGGRELLQGEFEMLAMAKTWKGPPGTGTGAGAWQQPSLKVPGLTLDKGNGTSTSASSANASSVAAMLINGHHMGAGRGGDDDVLGSSPPSPSGVMAFTRGRTYNIRIDDHILVKFTPRSPQSTYYLGDTVSGTLTFSQEEGARRCLEVSVLLETHEVVNPMVLHSSRKAGGFGAASKAPLHLPQVQTEFHEVTADMLATHFIFTIPMDAPAAFATPLISVQWILRFEFVACKRRKHTPGASSPLASEETERGEWSMPIVVHAPLPRAHPPNVFSLSVVCRWALIWCDKACQIAPV